MKTFDEARNAVLNAIDFNLRLSKQNKTIQNLVKDLINWSQIEGINPNTREHAIDVIAEVLYPNKELLCEDTEETRAIEQLLDKQQSDFVDKVQKLMQEKGISEKEMMNDLGLTEHGFVVLLNKVWRPSQKMILKIAKKLKVKPNKIWNKI